MCAWTFLLPHHPTLNDWNGFATVNANQQEERNGGRRRKSSLTCLKYDPSALSSQLKRWWGRDAKRFRGLSGNHGLLTEPRRCRRRREGLSRLIDDDDGD